MIRKANKSIRKDAMLKDCWIKPINITSYLATDKASG